MANAPYFDRVTPGAVALAYHKCGYPIDLSLLNIFAIRTADTTSNAFNDVIGILYWRDDEWKLCICDATTDPGLVSRTNPVNKRGTAIIVPGQYPDGWKLGKHRGKYTALVQNKPVKLYRDNNEDEKLDMDPSTIVEEMTGINIHHATANEGGKSVQVDNWSAGCMVIAAKDDWDKFIGIITDSKQTTFTVTLFGEQEFFHGK